MHSTTRDDEWKRLNVAPSRPLAAVPNGRRGNKCASSEESIDTNDNFKHRPKHRIASPVRRDVSARSMRRNSTGRRERRAQKRERSSCRLVYRSGVQEARVSKTCDVAPVRFAAVLLTNPAPVLIHFTCHFTRTRVARSHSREYRFFALYLILSCLFFMRYSAQPCDTPYGTTGASGRHTAPRIGRIRNYSQLSYVCRVRHVVLLAAIRSRLRCSSRCHPQVATFQGRESPA